MSTDLLHARVVDHLRRLRLGHVADRLDNLLSDVPRKELTYLQLLDDILGEEIGAKQRKRVAMGFTIAHSQVIKTLDDFDFKFQGAIDPRLVRELAHGRLVANTENVLLFGPPGVGKTPWPSDQAEPASRPASPKFPDEAHIRSQ